MKIVKRYKNRRLYDTDLKKYITHAELNSIIKLQIPFKVIDSRSGRDITLAVLGRLLVAEIRNWRNVKGSTEILTEIIRRGGIESMSILRNTFLASVGIYNLTKKKAEEVIDSLIKVGEISKSDRKQAVLELLDKAEESAEKMKDRVKKETGGMQKEVTKLVERIKKITDNLPPKKIMTELERLNKKVEKLAKAVENKK